MAHLPRWCEPAVVEGAGGGNGYAAQTWNDVLREDGRGHGRNDYPASPMWNALYSMAYGGFEQDRRTGRAETVEAVTSGQIAHPLVSGEEPTNNSS